MSWLRLPCPGACASSPAIILQWVYFGWKHKERVGTFQAVAEVETTAEKKEEDPNLRPKLFWVNLLIFVIALAALGVFGVDPYFVFIVATVVTAMLNYPKNFGEIFAKVGPMYLNILVMLIAINVYQAVFNNTEWWGLSRTHSCSSVQSSCSATSISSCCFCAWSSYT